MRVCLNTPILEFYCVNENLKLNEPVYLFIASIIEYNRIQLKHLIANAPCLRTNFNTT